MGADRPHTDEQIPGHVLARLSGIEKGQNETTGDIRAIKSCLRQLVGDVHKLTDAVGRVEWTTEEIKRRLDVLEPEHRISALERASSATRKRPDTDPPKTPRNEAVRKELDSLSDEIDDTKTALRIEQLERAFDRKVAEMQAAHAKEVAALQSGEKVGLARWQVIGLLITTAGAILAAAYGGRATAPSVPPQSTTTISVPVTP